MTTQRRTITLVATLVATILAAAFGGDPIEAATPTTIDVAPASVLQFLEEAVQLTTTVKNQNAQAMSDIAVARTSSHPEGATVDAPASRIRNADPVAAARDRQDDGNTFNFKRHGSHSDDGLSRMLFSIAGIGWLRRRTKAKKAEERRARAKEAQRAEAKEREERQRRRPKSVWTFVSGICGAIVGAIVAGWVTYIVNVETIKQQETVQRTADVYAEIISAAVDQGFAGSASVEKRTVASTQARVAVYGDSAILSALAEYAPRMLEGVATYPDTQLAEVVKTMRSQLGLESINSDVLYSILVRSSR